MSWYEAEIKLIKDKEYEIVYKNEVEPVYMTPDEAFTDIAQGDIEFL